MSSRGGTKSDRRRSATSWCALGHKTLVSLLLVAGVLVVPVIEVASAQANTLQMSADSSVTGWYPNEPQLSPAAVTGGSFGETFDVKLNGAVYAQPLVSQPTVLAVTEANFAYGLDSTTGAIEWQDSFGAPSNPLQNIGCGDVGSQLGITGTPVIDPTTGIAYFVAAKQEAGNTSADFMEAVNVQSGVPPSGWPAGGVPIAGSADGDPGTVFNANYQTQRPGLVLVNGVVYAAFGAQCDLKSWEGWLVGVSESTASITTMWSSEQGVANNVDGQPGAGIWQSGSAPVVDANGDIFVSTGNGDIPSGPEPGTDVANQTYGESVVKLHTDANGKLAPVDWFMAADASTLNSQDGDLGSGGPVALPASMGTTDDPNPMVVEGKQGIVYVLKMNNLGGYQQGPSNTDNVESETGPYGGVWSKASVWPGDGGYIYMPTAGTTPYVTGGGTLNVFQRTVTAGVLSFTLVGSTGNSGNVFGFGSGAPIITSNGTTSGSSLLWIVHSPGLGGANSQLEAFNPVPVNPGSNGTLEQVWTSTPFTSTTFSEPSVDNGVLYVGTRDGTLLGFGALPSSTPALAGTNLAFDPTVVAQSETKSESFTASAPTTVTSLTVTGSAYSVGTPSLSLPATLATGQSITVPVTFTPNALGANSGSLTANATGAAASVQLMGQGNTVNPSLSWTPNAVSFSPQLIGGPIVTMPVTVTNVSSSPISVSGFVNPTAPFYVNDPPTTPLTLNPSGSANDSFTFTVQFNPPSSSGNFEHDFNSLATVKTSLGNFGIAISGSADPPPQISTVPSSLNFGSVPVGSSATLNFVLGNQGATPLTITMSTPPTTNGLSALTDPLVQLQNTTPPDTIAPNTSIQESVQFAPTTNGPATAYWYIQGNDGSGVQTITLTGTGVPAGTITTVQSGDAGTSAIASGAAMTVLPANATVGDTVVVAVLGAGSTGQTVTSLTSPMGTFTKVTGNLQSGQSDVELWICSNVTTPARTITVTWSGAGLGFAQATEFSGSLSAVASTPTQGTGTSPTGSVTTTAPGGVALVYVNTQNITAAPSSPWVNYDAGAFVYSWGESVATQTVAAPSTVSASWTLASSVKWQTIGLSLAGSGGTTFTVTFNGNGSTGGSMANQVASSPTALSANAFTRTGYTFTGWNTAANGSGTPYADGATYPFSASTTLYAQWTAAIFSVEGNFATTGNFGLTTANVSLAKAGDLLVIWVKSRFTTNPQIHITNISASGTGAIGTLVNAIQYYTVDHPGNDDEIWYAPVITAGTVTLTFTWSGASSSDYNEYSTQEFLPSTPSTYSLDTANHFESNTTTLTMQFPSLTPMGAGELYAGYNSNNTRASIRRRRPRDTPRTSPPTAMQFSSIPTSRRRCSRRLRPRRVNLRRRVRSVPSSSRHRPANTPSPSTATARPADQWPTRSPARPRRSAPTPSRAPATPSPAGTPPPTARARPTPTERPTRSPRAPPSTRSGRSTPTR